MSRKSIKGRWAVKSRVRQKPITFAVDYGNNGMDFRMDKTNWSLIPVPLCASRQNLLIHLEHCDALLCLEDRKCSTVRFYAISEKLVKITIIVGGRHRLIIDIIAFYKLLEFHLRKVWVVQLWHRTSVHQTLYNVVAQGTSWSKCSVNQFTRCPEQWKHKGFELMRIY